MDRSSFRVSEKLYTCGDRYTRSTLSYKTIFLLPCKQQNALTVLFNEPFLAYELRLTNFRHLVSGNKPACFILSAFSQSFVLTGILQSVANVRPSVCPSVRPFVSALSFDPSDLPDVLFLCVYGSRRA